ncbi:hypothetical protein M9Y10_017610 [Tritrichomonas musculus]|uniref:Uncharacterized protein n=1 Tax=Tritrichomonas musculus TaxID=1915356 RepID=A0ABR2HU26_9EUKA
MTGIYSAADIKKLVSGSGGGTGGGTGGTHNLHLTGQTTIDEVHFPNSDKVFIDDYQFTLEQFIEFVYGLFVDETGQIKVDMTDYLRKDALTDLILKGITTINEVHFPNSEKVLFDGEITMSEVMGTLEDVANVNFDEFVSKDDLLDLILKGKTTFQPKENPENLNQQVAEFQGKVNVKGDLTFPNPNPNARAGDVSLKDMYLRLDEIDENAADISQTLQEKINQKVPLDTYNTKITEIEESIKTETDKLDNKISVYDLTTANKINDINGSITTLQQKTQNMDDKGQATNLRIDGAKFGLEYSDKNLDVLFYTRPKFYSGICFVGSAGNELSSINFKFIDFKQKSYLHIPDGICLTNDSSTLNGLILYENVENEPYITFNRKIRWIEESEKTGASIKYFDWESMSNTLNDLSKRLVNHPLPDPDNNGKNIIVTKFISRPYFPEGFCLKYNNQNIWSKEILDKLFSDQNQFPNYTLTIKDPEDDKKIYEYDVTKFTKSPYFPDGFWTMFDEKIIFSDEIFEKLKYIHLTHYKTSSNIEKDHIEFERIGYFPESFRFKTKLPKDGNSTNPKDEIDFIISGKALGSMLQKNSNQKRIEAKYLADASHFSKKIKYLPSNSKPKTARIQTFALEDVPETTTEEEDVNETNQNTKEITDTDITKVYQEHEEIWKETIDFFFENIEGTFCDLKENYPTNKQLGYICRNSLFCESMKNKIPLKALKPQELASYGFVEYEQSELEMYDEGGYFAVIIVSGEEISQTKSKLDITLRGLKHYQANHFIIHLFDRQRNIKLYDLNSIDHVFDLVLSGNNLTINSDLSSDLYDFTYSNTEDELKVSITGTLKLKLVEDVADNEYWNEEQGWEKYNDRDLQKRVVVYYQLPINENFKNYLASLESSSSGSSSGGTVDTNTSSRLLSLETQFQSLQKSIVETNNAIKKETDKGYQSDDTAKTFSLETHGVEGQEVVEQENLTFDQVLKNWVETNTKQIEYLNGGLSVCWDGINAIDDDIEYLMKKTCNCVNETNLHQLDDRLKILEKKCENIEGDTPTITTGELTLENLMRAYDERIRILEKKCENIV